MLSIKLQVPYFSVFKQIQDSIAQTFRRQAEALGKKRISGKATASTYGRRQSNYRNLRGRRNQRVVENQGSDEEEGPDGQDDSKDSSSAEEQSPEIKSKRRKRWEGARDPQPSSGANADKGCDENDSEANRRLLGPLVGTAGLLPWGRGGLRTTTRHAGLSWTNGRISRSNRLAKLINHLKCSHENNEVVRLYFTPLSGELCLELFY